MPKQKYAYKFIYASNQTKPNQNEPNRSEPNRNRVESSRVESSCVKTASPELKSDDCATFCCAWQTLSVCVCLYVCVCVLSNIVYMGLSGLWTLILILTLKSGFCLFVRSSVRPFVRWWRPNQLSKCPNFICYAHHKNWSKSFCQSHFDFECQWQCCY